MAALVGGCKGWFSSPSESSEEEERSTTAGGFLFATFTGVDVTGPAVGLFPRVEIGSVAQSTGRRFHGVGAVPSPPLSDLSAHVLQLGVLWVRPLRERGLLRPVSSWSSSSTASQMDAPGTERCRLVILSSTKSRFFLALGSSLKAWLAGVRRPLSANSCGFRMSVSGTCEVLLEVAETPKTRKMKLT